MVDSHYVNHDDLSPLLYTTDYVARDMLTEFDILNYITHTDYINDKCIIPK